MAPHGNTRISREQGARAPLAHRRAPASRHPFFPHAWFTRVEIIAAALVVLYSVITPLKPDRRRRRARRTINPKRISTRSECTPAIHPQARPCMHKSACTVVGPPGPPGENILPRPAALPAYIKLYPAPSRWRVIYRAAIKSHNLSDLPSPPPGNFRFTTAAVSVRVRCAR